MVINFMAESGLLLPSGSGGLMRYSDEYQSKLMITPTQVFIFIAVIIVLMAALKLFF